MKWPKVALAVAAALTVPAFLALDLGRLFSLEFLRESQQSLQAAYTQQPAEVLAIYFGSYLVLAVLSLPGAAVLTVGAGAIFGLLAGTVIVSFASSIGAMLAFLAARFLFRDLVRERFANRLKDVDAGLRRDGRLYLLTARLIPLIPFSAVNLVMGVTQIRTRSFYWISQLGMLPATVLYVNAGTQLGRLQSLHGILDPTIVGSFVLLGIFPWLGRWGAAIVGGRAVDARWQALRPGRFDRNLVVIGAGAAGLVSS